MNRRTIPARPDSGVVFSTHGGLPVGDRDWGFWYLERSKKVWFRVPYPAPGLQPLFRYEGRPILHRSEVVAWKQSGGSQPPPVVWGDHVGLGWSRGPQGTTLFLYLWTRWTWLHPEACGHPERFSVDFLRSTAAAGSERCRPPVVDRS